MERIIYPFTAIVGQESMRTALVLNAVDPSIGGVLIRGHKGTGKSTAVRALAALLRHAQPDEHMPLVELPLSATEDRVVGTLHIEHALKTGERVFEPGLLAAADKGILYVDEVNLLDDHLVDVLLDAAASGVNVVEREGISHAHPARFILIGTMNPEEGDLRPQFLDRFGLCVTVRGLNRLEDRRAIVLQRIAFERDPRAFLESCQDDESDMLDQIIRARAAVTSVTVPDAMVDLALRITTEVEAHGHRADIAIIKTASALAALLDRAEVEANDIAEAAQFVLPHRMKALPLDTPESLADKLRQAVSRALGGKPKPPQPVSATDFDDEEDMASSMLVPGATAAGYALFARHKKKRTP